MMRKLEVWSASDVTMKDTRFLRIGWTVVGSVNVLAGYGGLGKSTWWASEVALLTRGRLDGIYAGQPKNVLVLSAEDQWSSTLKPRLIVVDAELDRVKFVALASDSAEPTATGITIPDDIDFLRRTVVDHQIAWVILDPLVSFLSGTTDSHNDASTRHVLDPLNQLANELQIAITGVMHFNKSDTSNPYNKLSGSSAFWNAARSVVFFGQAYDASSDDPKRFLVAAKSNVAKLPKSIAYELQSHVAYPERPGDERAHTSRLVYVAEADISAAELFSAPSGTRPSMSRDCADLLTGLLDINGGVVPSEEYYGRARAEIGASDSTIGRGTKLAEAEPFKPGSFDEKTWWLRASYVDEAEALRIADRIANGPTTPSLGI